MLNSGPFGLIAVIRVYSSSQSNIRFFEKVLNGPEVTPTYIALLKRVRIAQVETYESMSLHVFIKGTLIK